MTVPRAAPFICAAKRRLPEASVLLIGLREALRIEVWSIVQDREHGDLVIVASVRDPILSDQERPIPVSLSEGHMGEVGPGEATIVTVHDAGATSGRPAPRTPALTRAPTARVTSR